ncbi:MAG: penicillin-binding protein [Candidatus Omnitrophica bacterium]|nr:penicillin-binding protein [Candidatus Omnitrophota bacterium]
MAFAVRLVLIQVFNSEFLAGLAKKQHNHLIVLEPKRGTIYDRNMRPLAINLPVYSMYANSKSMSEAEKQRAVSILSEKFGFDKKMLRNRLGRDKYFVWIQRKMTEEAYELIKAQKLKGIEFVKESKRYYPNKSLGSHIIGFAGIDNNGLEGMELQLDKYLKGKEGMSQILRDARQRELLLEKNYVAQQNGFNVILTIDETIQYIAERALEAGFKKHNAKGASIIVLNPKTGEILALANQPTYNLEEFSTVNPENKTNRALAFTYEPGSVFKIVAASAALEENAFKESDMIFCENGSYKVGNHYLKDHDPLGTLSFKEVIEQSSNIGTTKIAQKLGPDVFYQYAHKFRFGIKTGIDMVGETNGWLKKPTEWSKTSIGAIPIGQEVTVTAIQLAGAIAAIANDGVYMKPYIVKEIRDDHDQVIESFEPQVVDRVITPETAKRVQAILQGVVDNGTGKKAQIPGITVAGKTGTAQKVEGGLYSHSKFYASFLGFAPVDDPQLAAIVIYDEPHPAYYGGTVSAPVFQEVISDSLKYISTLQDDDQ